MLSVLFPGCLLNVRTEQDGLSADFQLSVLNLSNSGETVLKAGLHNLGNGGS